MDKVISILGSTGSIGMQTIEVARKLGIKICALAANRNVQELEAQAREFNPKIVAVYNEDAAKKLKIALSDTDIKVLSGTEGVCEAAVCENADITLNAVVGIAGLLPTLAAINAKKDIALANKETLVAGGSLVKQALKENNVCLYPVDSEHSAVFQCLESCRDKKDLKKIILTASGGPFFGKTMKELLNVHASDALKHPTWNMGAKVTIDSSTLMNKGLEIMEAGWLFDMPEDKIDVVVHRESIVHSMIEYNDNAVIAQLGMPDMKLPIQYAITYPHRMVCPTEPLDLAKIGKLTFFNVDDETFLCYKACRNAMRRGGLVPAAVNGANEAAVELFLKDKIAFNKIGELVYKVSERNFGGEVTIENILETDRAARDYIINSI